MHRVELSHGLNGLFLLVFGFFAASVLAIGVLLIIGAERLAASPDAGGSALTWIITGAVVAVIGLAMVRIATRNAGAVAIIDIDDGRNWHLKTRFGRELAVVPPDEGRRFELRGRRIIILAAAVPKVQEVVEGRLFLRESSRSFRLAVSGPTTYDVALDQLGFEQAAPRPGEDRVY